MYRKLSAPITVQWEVTYDCNKNCVHCYNYWRDNKTKLIKNGNFNKEKSNQIVDDIIKNKVFHVVITGGEPMIVMEELYPYLQKLLDNNIEVTINSNLSYFPDKICNNLISMGINSLLVSVPASNKELDFKITNCYTAFDNTIIGIKRAIKAGFNISANMVVSKLNYHDIFNTGKLVKSLGIRSFSMTRAVQPSNCKDFEKYKLSISEFCTLPEKLKEVKDKLGLNVFSVEAYPLCFIDDFELIKETGFDRLCTAGKTFCAIDPNGAIRPCILLSDSVNLDLRNAWDSFDEYREDTNLPDECKGCKFEYTCGGGCKAERKHSCGCFKVLDPFANLKNKYEYDETQPDIKVTSTIEDCFKVNSHLKFREEDFGGIFYLANNNFIAVDNNLYTFIKNNNIFSASKFIKENKYSEIDGLKTIEFLKSKRMIILEKNDKKRI